MWVINTRSFSQFWAVSWNITHCFWVPKRFTMLLNPKVRLRVGHQHSHFLADSGPFHGLLLTVLGSWSDFHY